MSLLITFVVLLHGVVHASQVPSGPIRSSSAPSARSDHPEGDAMSVGNFRQHVVNGRLSQIKHDIMIHLGWSTPPTLPFDRPPVNVSQLQQALKDFDLARRRDEAAEHPEPATSRHRQPNQKPRHKLNNIRKTERRTSAHTHRLVLVASTETNLSNSAEIEFRVSKEDQLSDHSLQVTSADINVLLRQVRHRRPALNGTHNNRLDINVYAVQGDGSAAGDKTATAVDRWSRSPESDRVQSPLTALILVTPNRRRHQAGHWQSLPLPTTFVQEVLDSSAGVLRLKVACVGCESVGRELVLSAPDARRRLRTVETGTRSNAIAEAKARSQPYIVIHAKRLPVSKSREGAMSSGRRLTDSCIVATAGRRGRRARRPC